MVHRIIYLWYYTEFIHVNLFIDFRGNIPEPQWGSDSAKMSKLTNKVNAVHHPRARGHKYNFGLLFIPSRKLSLYPFIPVQNKPISILDLLDKSSKLSTKNVW